MDLRLVRHELLEKSPLAVRLRRLDRSVAIWTVCDGDFALGKVSANRGWTTALMRKLGFAAKVKLVAISIGKPMNSGRLLRPTFLKTVWPTRALFLSSLERDKVEWRDSSRKERSVNFGVVMDLIASISIGQPMNL